MPPGPSCRCAFYPRPDYRRVDPSSPTSCGSQMVQVPKFRRDDPLLASKDKPGRRCRSLASNAHQYSRNCSAGWLRTTAATLGNQLLAAGFFKKVPCLASPSMVSGSSVEGAFGMAIRHFPSLTAQSGQPCSHHHPHNDSDGLVYGDESTPPLPLPKPCRFRSQTTISDAPLRL